MASEKSLLKALKDITEFSNNGRLLFEQKINKILLEITDLMQAKKGSIMLFKNRTTLEVVASTNPRIIGVRQKLDGESPSAWVVKNKKSLYVDSSTSSDVDIGRFKHYQSDAFFLAPIISHDKVIGVVSVTEKVGSDFFAQDEREMLLLVVGQVISALENNRLAEALNQKQKTLKKKNAELKKLEKLRTDLFNMLIHDLKGPISEIVANLDILSYTLEDENAQFVEIAQQGCNTLYNMVTNLLDISRLEEGQMPFVYEDICPRELIKEAVARLLVSGKSKALTIEEQFPEENSVRLHGDRATLVRVLQNFITNAIQYSPQGGAVTVGYQRSALKRVELFVKDSGPGVKPEFQEVIFDKYKQVDKQADGRLYTTGLGLAFCKLAVEAHHGSVGVESTPGAGSKFYFVVAVE